MYVFVARQSDAELGGIMSVLVRQKRDHETLDRLLYQLEDARPQEQAVVLGRVSRLVFPHAFAEEVVLWPVMRRVLPEGEELTLAVEQEHQEVSDLVPALDRMPPDDPRRGVHLARLLDVLRDDARDEEDDLLPRVQDRVGETRLRLLGVAWEVLRRTAPTRPHPLVARRPPGNALSAVPLTLIDRSRDVLDDAAIRVPGWGRRILAPMSRRLGRLAHRVEGIPLMQKGEHSSSRGSTPPMSPLVVAAPLLVVLLVLLVVLSVVMRRGARS